MRRFFLAIVVLGIIGLGVFWFVTAPKTLTEEDIAGLTPDPVHGETVFWAAGCASCHAAPEASGDAKLVLTGGQSFPSDFGTFKAPNISPDTEAGIGAWSTLDLVNAVVMGVSPSGTHYYPAFPYASYRNADLQDIVDLSAFLKSLPASDVSSQPNDIAFPFSYRRLLGGWKFLFDKKGWVVTILSTPEEERGRYLVEALGHCGECHTPRNDLGAMEKTQWLAGAPIPGSDGKVPNITPAVLDWSEQDIAYYLETGFTPDFDSAGGHMTDVIENMAMLTAEDREAIAAYLKRVPPVN